MEFNYRAFGTHYRELESEWDDRMDVVIDSMNGKRPTEEQLTEVLFAIKENAMDFTKLTMEESVFFLQIAFPRTFLYETRMTPSPFLKLYSELRDDNLVDWLKHLYNFLGRGHNIFAYAVRANLKACNYRECDLGGALIEAFQADGFEVAIVSTLGQYVNNPWIPSLARCHEDQLYKITGQLQSPEQVGYLVRQFVLFILRGKRKTDCKCGWLPLREECTCVPNLENDPCKEYICVLLSLFTQRRTGKFDQLTRACGASSSGTVTYNDWTDDMQDRFMQVACSHVLSEVSYKKIRATLSMSVDMTMEKFEARILTDTEQKSNFQGAFSQHSGCQHAACKQAMKGDCSNVSCGTHCASDGYLPCKPHRYEGFEGGPPKKQPRIPFTLQQLTAMARAEN